MFLGFDLSTQSLKAVLLDTNGTVLKEASLNFDEELPHYAISGGVHMHGDEVTQVKAQRKWNLSKMRECQF